MTDGGLRRSASGGDEFGQGGPEILSFNWNDRDVRELMQQAVIAAAALLFFLAAVPQAQQVRTAAAARPIMTAAIASANCDRHGNEASEEAGRALACRP